MKIKLAVLDCDKNYLDRMASAFTSKYPDKLELYTFTVLNTALESISNSRIDVLLSSDNFDIDTSKLPKRCGFAYFVESSNVETYKDYRAICKYRKAEIIYKEILSIYSEKVSDTIGFKLEGDSSTSIITFISASGGVGSSTIAAICAKYFARAGKKVLYMNLEQFSSTDLFFSGEGMFSLSDVIYSLKSKKSSLSLKLESYVKQDPFGVHFYSSAKTALDIKELNEDDLERLINELKLIASYDYIILDIDFLFNKPTIQIFKKSKSIVIVSDGTEIARQKFNHAYKSFEILDETMDIPLLSKLVVVYNKYSNKTSKTIEGCSIKTIGGVRRFEYATVAQITEQLLEMDMFEKLL